MNENRVVLQSRLNASRQKLTGLREGLRGTNAEARAATIYLTLTTEEIEPAAVGGSRIDDVKDVLAWEAIALLYVLVVAGPFVLLGILVWLAFRLRRRQVETRLLEQISRQRRHFVGRSSDGSSSGWAPGKQRGPRRANRDTPKEDNVLGTRAAAALAVSILAFVVLTAPGAGAPSPRANQPQKKASKLAFIIEDVAANVARERGAGRSGTRASNAAVRATADGAIEVAIWSKEPIGGRERADLAKLGATPTASFSRGAQGGKPAVGVIQAQVPFDKLNDLAALDWVAAVTPPGYGETDNHPTNPINSQGVALHNADDVQTRGINGAGVTVGVISDGVRTSQPHRRRTSSRRSRS